MPITINYAANPENDRDLNLLLPQNEIIYGKNEMNFGWTGDRNPPDLFVRYGHGFASVARNYNFEFSKKFDKNSIIADRGVQDLKNMITGMHYWLSENMQGPWYLKDDMSHYDRRHDNDLIIERYDDREKFSSSNFGAAFQPIVQQWDNELESLAILKGVVQPYSQYESYPTWTRCNGGYNAGSIEIENEDFVYIQPECEEVKDLLEKTLVADGIYRANENGIYICPKDKFDWHLVNEWKCNADGLDLNPEGSNGCTEGMSFMDGSVIAFKYSSIEKKFKDNWGSHFQYNKEHKFYYSNKKDYPLPPAKRTIPQEFIDYLHGRAPDPSLKLQLST